MSGGRGWQYFKPSFDFKEHNGGIISAWDGHEFFVYDLIRNLRPKKIVELGTHFGFSFFVMAQAVKDGGLESSLFAIDTWKGDHQSGLYDESVYASVKDVVNKFYKKQSIELIKKDFNEAEKAFGRNSIDILHIDGLHTYEAVKKDFDTWLPKMKKNGVIMFHDIKETKEDFGVYRLWEELENRFSTIRFVHSHGLGVVFLGEKPLGIEIDYYYYLNEQKQIETSGREMSKAAKELSVKTEEIVSLNEQLNILISKNSAMIEELERVNSELFSIKNTKIWRTREKIVKKYFFRKLLEITKKGIRR